MNCQQVCSKRSYTPNASLLKPSLVVQVRTTKERLLAGRRMLMTVHCLPLYFAIFWGVSFPFKTGPPVTFVPVSLAFPSALVLAMTFCEVCGI